MTPDWSVVGQFSSIGSLGTEANKWLTAEWLQSLSQCRKHSSTASSFATASSTKASKK